MYWTYLEWRYSVAKWFARFHTRRAEKHIAVMRRMIRLEEAYVEKLRDSRMKWM